MLDIYDLRCEYLINPLGIGTPKPRFFWKLKHTDNCQSQSAYRIRAAASEELLVKGDYLWDSGKMASGNSVAVEWGGDLLQSRQRVYWNVECWDAKGESSSISETAWFETALLDEDDWKAEWIGFPADWIGRALYFRRDVNISKPNAKARMYVSGLGYHEIFINGERLGEDVLDPAYTDISKTIMYRTFDVGNLLNCGANTVAVTVGHGWHGYPRLLLQLEITFEDDTVETIGSQDTGWAITTGPVVASALYSGETYDAREEQHGWNLPNTELTGKWVSALPVPHPGGKMVPQTIAPIRIMQSIEPKSIVKLQCGDYLVDLGQNIAGWVQLRVKGERGQKVVLKFAESLYEDGSVNQENLRQMPAIDTYILKGGVEEVWEPRFTYHGFRYVQVTGYPEELSKNGITGRVVRSSVQNAGEFRCSSELLNRIQEMVWWTEQDNYHGIPTDCPQRNERMGWLNDMAARTEESLFNFNLSDFLPKFIEDIKDSQHPVHGGVPLTAPRGWMATRDPMEPLSISYLEMAWLLYAHYGDRRTLENCYSGLQKWMEKMHTQAKDYISTFAVVADWAPPIDKVLPGTTLSGAPVELIATGYYYYGAKLLERIAGVLNRVQDQQNYADLAQKIYSAFNEHFWDDSVGGFGVNNQSCNAFALWLHLVPENHIAQAMHNLVQNVVDIHDNHLTTGNICTKYLLEALSSNGRSDIALSLAEQTTYPSWGYMLANGATTVWERWEHDTSSGMNSHNHPMMASVSSWFFKSLAGINISYDAFGFNRFVLQPAFVNGIDYVDVVHETVLGKIKSCWKRHDKSILYAVEIPIGSQAEIVLAGEVQMNQQDFVLDFYKKENSHIVVGSGSYQFKVNQGSE